MKCQEIVLSGGGDAPKGDEPCDSICVAFLKCQNYRNGEQISG